MNPIREIQKMDRRSSFIDSESINDERLSIF